MKQTFKRLTLLLLTLFLAGCEGTSFIVNDIDEREANEIVVYLASKNIEAIKVKADTGMAAGGTGPTNMWSISVDGSDETRAMALLNQVGLPRRKGTNLLEIFAKQGLMSSDKEENIRFQAGLAEQLKNTIRKIDGVLDVAVEISFPIQDGSEAVGVAPTQEKRKITAAVYVKHQGVLEDPNNHLETKIKRLLAGSVQGLDFDNVAVISDRSRFMDISLDPEAQEIAYKGKTREYVSIWGVVMTKNSLSTFRTIFFTMIFLLITVIGFLAWMTFKNYPEIVAKIGIKKRKKEE